MLLRVDTIELENFRCFEKITLELEPDLTVLFGENGGGKTVLLTAIAMGLAECFHKIPEHLRLDRERDPRQIRSPGGRLEAAGESIVSYRMVVDEHALCWRATTARATDHPPPSPWFDRILVPSRAWPLVCFYGTKRLWPDFKDTLVLDKNKRTDGYADALQATSNEKNTISWLIYEFMTDQQYLTQGTPRPYIQAVRSAILQATPGVTALWYDLARRELRIGFEDGREVGWDQLSDGYHAFLALVIDLARRAIILNDHLGARAVVETEGVVLIDEIDLHLHPRWQRTVLKGLRQAFPKIQFVVTTHSPQVLSSVKNRQIRLLRDFQVIEKGIYVEDRNTDAILRESMNTDARPPDGQALIEEVQEAIQRGAFEDAQRKISNIRQKWGAIDPEVVKAQAMLDWEIMDARDS